MTASPLTIEQVRQNQAIDKKPPDVDKRKTTSGGIIMSKRKCAKVSILGTAIRKMQAAGCRGSPLYSVMIALQNLRIMMIIRRSP